MFSPRKRNSRQFSVDLLEGRNAPSGFGVHAAVVHHKDTAGGHAEVHKLEKHSQHDLTAKVNHAAVATATHVSKNDSTTGTTDSKDSTTGTTDSKDSTTGTTDSKDSTTEAKDSKDSTTGTTDSKDSTTGAKDSKDSTTGTTDSKDSTPETNEVPETQSPSKDK